MTVAQRDRYADLRVNSAAASAIANAYLETPTTDARLTGAVYAQLERETDELFHAITTADRHRPVRVVFTTTATPYDTADELITSVRHHRLLELVTVRTEPDRHHPLMDCDVGGAYDRFRAVHDLLGHALLVVGFDRDGEYATWRFQEQFHTPLARRALATELHGEHSVRWTTGELPEHRAVILHPCLVNKSRRLRPRDHQVRDITSPVKTLCKGIAIGERPGSRQDRLYAMTRE